MIIVNKSDSGRDTNNKNKNNNIMIIIIIVIIRHDQLSLKYTNIQLNNCAVKLYTIY